MAKIILCEILKFAETSLRSTLRDDFLGVELPSLSVIPKDFLISDRDLCRTVSHASMTCVVLQAPAVFRAKREFFGSNPTILFSAAYFLL